MKCPFCGNKAKLKFYKHKNLWQVRCKICGARSSFSAYKKAIKNLWNHLCFKNRKNK